MTIRNDETCPECEGSGKDPLDSASACPLCGGDGRMSFEKAMQALDECGGGLTAEDLRSMEAEGRLELKSGEQN